MLRFSVVLPEPHLIVLLGLAAGAGGILIAEMELMTAFRLWATDPERNVYVLAVWGGAAYCAFCVAGQLVALGTLAIALRAGDPDILGWALFAGGALAVAWAYLWAWHLEAE